MMKLWAPLLILCSLLLGPWAVADIPFHIEHLNELQKRLDEGLGPVTTQEDLLRRIEGHREVTSYTRSLGTFLVQEIQNDRDLSGTHLNLINSAIGTFLTLTKRLVEEADFLAEQGLNFDQAPHRTMIWLTLMSVATERFKIIQSLYFTEQGLRKILQDKTRFELYGLGELGPLTARLLSQPNRDQVQRFLGQAITRTNLPDSPFREILQTTYLYQLALAGESTNDVFRASTFWTDRIGAMTEAVARALSHAFGNAVGDIEWRTGHLHLVPGLEEEVLQQLRPLDLIYEKRRFKLTDYTIPAHWGHLAVWLGTKEELIELGIWDHPALDFFRESIERGESVYEVRRWGLQFDTLENFLNLDEFAITRVGPILEQSTEEIAEIYELLARQWTKKYDFTFNALATDRVTCTEIVFLSYGSINWPRGVTLGRTTITPDHMAELAHYSNSPMEFVAFYTASERHQVRRHTPAEFARTVGYVYRPERSREDAPYFEQHHRICQNQRVRRHGAIRMHMVCRDEFEHKGYQPPTSFDLDFSFAF